MKYEFVVTAADADRRLDRFVAAHLDRAPTSLVRRLLRQKKIRVNDERPAADRRLRVGDVVVVHHTPPARDPSPGTIPPYAGPSIAVLAERDGFLFVDKPVGVACSDDGDDPRALARWLADRLRVRIDRGEVRPEPCHRLDRDTTGVVAVALTVGAFDRFRRALDAGRVTKTYEVVAHGEAPEDRFEVDLPLVRARRPRADEPRMVDGRDAPDEARLDALTRFTVLERSGGLVRLRAEPVTGRTHQIRAHCRLAGLPVLGDPRYGDPARDAAVGIGRGQWLHARRLRLHDDGDALEVEAPWPNDRIEWMRRHGLVGAG